MAKKREALLDVLQELGEAQAVIATAQAALQARDTDCDEAVTLRAGLRLLAVASAKLEQAS